jgi:hypothetical protein
MFSSLDIEDGLLLNILEYLLGSEDLSHKLSVVCLSFRDTMVAIFTMYQQVFNRIHGIKREAG